MSNRDYYEVLGISVTATHDEIKSTYRKLAMKHHPDRQQGGSVKAAEEKFKECKEAYEMLSDPQKRAAYDRYRFAGEDSSRHGGMGNDTDYDGAAEAVGDIFDEMFGQDVDEVSGDDLCYSMAITLEEAADGKDAQISIPSREVCGTCHGTGVSPGISRNTCTTCHGQGKLQRKKTLEVKIPAGIDDGMRIRCSGEGEPGINGGPPGDLYIEIHIKQHQIFERDGDDLHCTVPISFCTAALGGEIEVPLLGGKAAIDIPEGTQTGKQFRLRGKGIKGLRSRHSGNLYCHIRVETPINLTSAQKKLLKELDESLRNGDTKDDI